MSRKSKLQNLLENTLNRMLSMYNGEDSQYLNIADTIDFHKRSLAGSTHLTNMDQLNERHVHHLFSYHLRQSVLEAASSNASRKVLICPEMPSRGHYNWSEHIVISPGKQKTNNTRRANIDFGLVDLSSNPEQILYIEFKGPHGLHVEQLMKDILKLLNEVTHNEGTVTVDGAYVLVFPEREQREISEKITKALDRARQSGFSQDLLNSRKLSKLPVYIISKSTSKTITPNLLNKFDK